MMRFDPDGSEEVPMPWLISAVGNTGASVASEYTAAGGKLRLATAP